MVLFIFLQVVIRTWRMLRVVRWDDKVAITHDPLRMRDGVIVLDNVTDLDEGHLR
jgi:hypothetical protein